MATEDSRRERSQYQRGRERLVAMGSVGVLEITDSAASPERTEGHHARLKRLEPVSEATAVPKRPAHDDRAGPAVPARDLDWKTEVSVHDASWREGSGHDVEPVAHD
jgi:hypothetical protein